MAYKSLIQMKKLFFLSPLLILLSCGQPRENEESKNIIPKEAIDRMMKADDSLQAIIKANIDKKPTIDTVFLGFTFNMEKKQFLAHFKELVKSKKLIKRERDGKMVYPMAFDLVKANAQIGANFEGERLSDLGLVIDGADDVATSETIYLQTAAAYMKRYKGFNFFEEPEVLDPTEKQYHWIKNNLHIFLHKTLDGITVSYINMLQERSSKKKETDGLDSLKSRTQQDI